MSSHLSFFIPNRYPRRGASSSQVIYPCFLLMPPLKKRVSQCEDYGTRPRAKSPKSEQCRWIQDQHHCHPSKISLRPHPPPGEDMFEQIKSELEPNLFLPGGETLSWEPKFRDQVITTTTIAWQGGRYNVTIIFIIGILFIFFFHWAKKEQQLNPPEQEISEGREKPSEVGPLISLQNCIIHTTSSHLFNIKFC